MCCSVLLIDRLFNDRIHDIILILTYVAPEKSPIFSPENDEIVIFNEKIFTIKSVYSEAELFLAEDLNART